MWHLPVRRRNPDQHEKAAGDAEYRSQNASGLIPDQRSGSPGLEQHRSANDPGCQPLVLFRVLAKMLSTHVRHEWVVDNLYKPDNPDHDQRENKMDGH